MLYGFVLPELGMLECRKFFLGHPGDDSPAQDGVNGAGVKVPEHLQWDLKVSEPPEEAE